jgi:hypothetical protein
MSGMDCQGADDAPMRTCLRFQYTTCLRWEHVLPGPSDRQTFDTEVRVSQNYQMHSRGVLHVLNDGCSHLEKAMGLRRS